MRYYKADITRIIYNKTDSELDDIKSCIYRVFKGGSTNWYYEIRDLTSNIKVHKHLINIIDGLNTDVQHAILNGNYECRFIDQYINWCS